jgi:hypothetical protein
VEYTIGKVFGLKEEAHFCEGRPMVSESEAAGRVTSSIWLSTGHHVRREDGMNIMECVAYVCGEEHSSYPTTACPVISEVARTIADAACDTDRQTLVDFIYPIACSGATDTVTFKRLFYCVDFVVRQLAPAALLYLNLPQEASALQSLEEIRETKSAERVYESMRKLVVESLIYSKASPSLSELHRAVHMASRVLSSDCDALSVLLALKGVMRRFEKQADSHLANMLFRQKHTLLKNLLEIGPTKPVDPDVLRARRRNLLILQSGMAKGWYGRMPGSEQEL